MSSSAHQTASGLPPYGNFRRHPGQRRLGVVHTLERAEPPAIRTIRTAVPACPIVAPSARRTVYQCLVLSSPPVLVDPATLIHHPSSSPTCCLNRHSPRQLRPSGSRHPFSAHNEHHPLAWVRRMRSCSINPVSMLILRLVFPRLVPNASAPAASSTTPGRAGTASYYLIDAPPDTQTFGLTHGGAVFAHRRPEALRNSARMAAGVIAVCHHAGCLGRDGQSLPPRPAAGSADAPWSGRAWPRWRRCSLTTAQAGAGTRDSWTAFAGHAPPDAAGRPTREPGEGLLAEHPKGCVATALRNRAAAERQPLQPHARQVLNRVTPPHGDVR